MRIVINWELSLQAQDGAFPATSANLVPIR